MFLIPKYAENIIVAVVVNAELSWYVTEKEIWYMDYKRRIEEFKKAGLDIDIDHPDDLRNGLLILDSDNIQTFQKRLRNFRVSVIELKNFILKEKQENTEWQYDCSPSLYLNFDKRLLYSLYREMAFYEFYVPPAWKGEYRDFLNEIPKKFRYWDNNEFI